MPNNVYMLICILFLRYSTLRFSENFKRITMMKTPFSIVCQYFLIPKTKNSGTVCRIKSGMTKEIATKRETLFAMTKEEWIPACAGMTDRLIIKRIVKQ